MKNLIKYISSIVVVSTILLLSVNITNARISNPISSAPTFTATDLTATSTFAHGIQVGDGNASFPGYSFVNDTNTGFYRDASDRIAVVNGGSVRGYFTTAWQLPPGSAAAPGMTFSSNTGYGLTYRTDGNTRMGLSAAAIEVLSLVSTGSVGIGSTTPIANFQATASTTNATTSIQFGKANQNKGTCRTEYDTAGGPVYIYIKAGAAAYTMQNGGTAPSGCVN